MFNSGWDTGCYSSWDSCFRDSCMFFVLVQCQGPMLATGDYFFSFELENYECVLNLILVVIPFSAVFHSFSVLCQIQGGIALFQVSAFHSLSQLVSDLQQQVHLLCFIDQSVRYQFLSVLELITFSWGLVTCRINGVLYLMGLVLWVRCFSISLVFTLYSRFMHISWVLFTILGDYWPFAWNGVYFG